MAAPNGYPQCKQAGCTTPAGINKLYLTQGAPAMSVPFACEGCFTRLSVTKGPEAASTIYTAVTLSQEE